MIAPLKSYRVRHPKEEEEPETIVPFGNTDKYLKPSYDIKKPIFRL